MLTQLTSLKLNIVEPTKNMYHEYCNAWITYPYGMHGKILATKIYLPYQAINQAIYLQRSVPVNIIYTAVISVLLPKLLRELK